MLSAVEPLGQVRRASGGLVDSWNRSAACERTPALSPSGDWLVTSDGEDPLGVDRCRTSRVSVSRAGSALSGRSGSGWWCRKVTGVDDVLGDVGQLEVLL